MHPLPSASAFSPRDVCRARTVLPREERGRAYELDASFALDNCKRDRLNVILREHALEAQVQAQAQAHESAA